MFEKFVQLIILFSVFGVFEIFYSSEIFPSIKSKIRNVVYTVILLFLGGSIAAGIFVLFPFQPKVVVTTTYYELIVLTLMYLFLFDFFFYWYHRAEHYFSLLWPIHELHHSDAELNATSSQRSHWLEQPLQNMLIFFPTIYIIGYNEVSIYAFSIVLTIILVFSHSNIKLRMGMWTSVICGPQLHRIHHSIHSEHNNKNYAQVFPIIDIVFGTFYMPQNDEFPETGIYEMKSDEEVLKTFMKPFKYWFHTFKKRIGKS